MGFGQWVREARSSKGLSVNALAEQVELNASSISRIENETTSPTVETAVRIFKVLGADAADFYRAVTNIRNLDLLPNPENGTAQSSVPTMDDVIAFDTFCHQNPTMGRPLLCRWLNKVYTVDLAGSEGDVGELKPEDIDKLLSDSRVYTLEVHYPALIESRIIRDICRQGGVILHQDVFRYTYEKLYRKESRPLPDERLFPLSVLNNLRLAESIRKITLSDLVRLDEYCGTHGEITVLCLKAVEFEMVVIPNPARPIRFITRPSNWRNLAQFKLGYVLVLISRWIEVFRSLNVGLFEANWLQEIREEMTPKPSSPLKVGQIQ